VFLLFAGVIAASALLGAARAWQPAAAALAAVSVTATAVLLAGGQGTFTPDVSRGTVRALAGIEQRHPGAALLADDVTSGPLLWQMPALAGKIAFDARLEVVSHAALDRYATFLLGGHGWQSATRGYGVVVVSRTTDPGLAGRMSGASGWSLAYRDSTDAVFVANRIRVNADKGRRS